LFAEKAKPSECRELLQLAKDLDASYKACASVQPSEQQLFDLRGQHMQFHLKLAEGANCPFLYEAIEKNQILIFNWFFDRLFGAPDLPANWHRQLPARLTKYVLVDT